VPLSAIALPRSLSLSPLPSSPQQPPPPQSPQQALPPPSLSPQPSSPQQSPPPPGRRGLPLAEALADNAIEQTEYFKWPASMDSEDVVGATHQLGRQPPTALPLT